MLKILFQSLGIRVRAKHGDRCRGVEFCIGSEYFQGCISARSHSKLDKSCPSQVLLLLT